MPITDDNGDSTLRRSKRSRIPSKGVKDPDFEYDLKRIPDEWEEQGLLSASASNALDKLKRRLSSSHPNLSTTGIARDKPHCSVGNVNSSSSHHKNKTYKGGNLPPKEKLEELRLQRIDCLFRGSVNAASGTEEGSNVSLFRAETINNLSSTSVSVSQIDISHDDSFVSTTDDINKLQPADLTANIKESGKHINPEAIELRNIANFALEEEQEHHINMNKEELRSLFKDLMDEMKNDMKVELNASIKQTMDESLKDLKRDVASLSTNYSSIKDSVSNIQTSATSLGNDLKATKNELETCKMNLQATMNMVIKQDQVLKECKGEIEKLKLNATKDWMRITGVAYEKNENPKEVVNGFLKHKLKIDTAVELKDAFRVGSGKYRPLLFQLNNVTDKAAIFNGAKNLKNVVNEKKQTLPHQQSINTKGRSGSQ